MDNSHHRNCCYHFNLIECHHYRLSSSSSSSTSSSMSSMFVIGFTPACDNKTGFNRSKKEHNMLMLMCSSQDPCLFSFNNPTPIFCVHSSVFQLNSLRSMQFCNAALLSDDTITKFTIMLYFDLTNMIVATIHTINTTRDLLGDPK